MLLLLLHAELVIHFQSKKLLTHTLDAKFLAREIDRENLMIKYCVTFIILIILFDNIV